ncbi:MAG TPA: type II toxin-antitoxin system VapC family toxin [Vicinamibacterales bacterium]|nr:type II toxin-antitoxin system VapC family toxin [Vicinamibacterales bacterium]
MILVDTSVWVDHLRRHSARLAALLEDGQVVCHPFVLGELALGSLRNRAAVLELLAELPGATVVSHDEAMALVERHDLPGAGIGWVDVHLLAAALVQGLPIWTNDKRLDAAARRLDAAWRP